MYEDFSLIDMRQAFITIQNKSLNAFIIGMPESKSYIPEWQQKKCYIRYKRMVMELHT